MNAHEKLAPFVEHLNGEHPDAAATFGRYTKIAYDMSLSTQEAITVLNAMGLQLYIMLGMLQEGIDTHHSLGDEEGANAVKILQRIFVGNAVGLLRALDSFEARTRT